MSGLPRLTDWIDGRIKPTIPGVYQRQYLSGGVYIAQYARWDGLRWYKSQITPTHAHDVTLVSDYPWLAWRGLSEPPQ